MHHVRLIVLCLSSLLLTPAQTLALATEPSTDEALEIDPITVIAHRQPRSLSEVAGTVTVIGEERIRRDLALDLPGLVRYEPGVEVDGGGTRFGFGGFRIRGIGGNRTALLVDDVPAANRFTVGNFADSGRGLLELGLVERVEILRGPASTIYGSKALGGVVALSLIDAEDLLFGADRATRIGLAGASDADRLRATAATAARNGPWSGLLAASLQRTDEVDVAERPPELAVDRLDREQQAVLVRIARETGLGRLRLTLDAVNEDREADLRAALGSGRFRNTTLLIGDDRSQRLRLLLDQALAPTAFADRGQWRAWYQASDTRQDTRESRPLASTPVDLFRRFDVREETSGFGIDLERDLDIFGRAHRFGYGLEIQHSELRQQRDALQTSLENGSTTAVVLGEAFPLRDFPVTEVTEFGAYVYDELRLWDGGPTLSPGVRFEYYELDSQADPLYTDAFPDTPLTDLDTSAWAPRLGLVWPLADGLEVFAQYARGFRSPPFSDVNIGLDIPMFNIRALPNPDLEPERGHTLEGGLRYRSRPFRAELAVFRNRYEDFISTRAFVGVDPSTGTLLFQSINRERVRIEGAELRVRGQLPGPFAYDVAAEWLRGEDRESGRSLPEISPPQAIVALEYAPDPRWQLRLAATLTRDQRRLVDEDGETLFSAPGSTAIDLLGRWTPGPDLSVSLGLFNLTDERYWNHANVIGRPGNDPTLPLLAEPGTHARVMVDWMF
ncbi:TonB-dependent receptor [Wenzhouxiangella sp. XN79A]|uniref:TonB-dependent receptor n=1 Tax=Wenzhouxiangella sp. XN79A TaxID=2724193 RepID=UPI00144ABAB4|nr:TonB-dependent receptor [Wenzhouxiangella sp. XN79A]NKI35367.1 TonB-dependent receptor [Wenzhouxiangella sp. XN79A]